MHCIQICLITKFYFNINCKPFHTQIAQTAQQQCVGWPANQSMTLMCKLHTHNQSTFVPYKFDLFKIQVKLIRKSKKKSLKIYIKIQICFCRTIIPSPARTRQPRFSATTSKVGPHQLPPIVLPPSWTRNSMTWKRTNWTMTTRTRMKMTLTKEITMTSTQTN